MVEWPTDTLRKEVEKSHFDTEERIGIWLASNVEDITYDDEAKTQLVNYAPHIVLVGLGLRRELETGLWGGLLVRALQGYKGHTKKRCLQYVYIWTRQQSIVSFFWMILVPALMGTWGLIITGFFGFLDWPYSRLVIGFQDAVSIDFWGTLLTPSELWLPSLACGLTCLPLLVAAILLHRWDLYSGSGISFRSVTLLIPYSVIIWLVPFNWLFSMVIIAATIVLSGTYWILERRKILKTSHDMDYLPVFVYLDADENDDWHFVSASWDRHHYNTETIYRKALEDSKNLAIHRDKTEKEVGGRVRLQMANPWHAVRPGGWVARPWWPTATKLAAVVFSFTIIRLLLFIRFDQYAEFPFPGLNFVFYLTLLVTSGVIMSAIPTKLVPDEEMGVNELALPSSVNEIDSGNYKNHLSKPHLKVLWNLVRRPDDKSPRFVIVTKLQDPFNRYNYPCFESNFRDDLEYLYEYIKDRVHVEATREAGAAFEEAIIGDGIEIDPDAFVVIETNPAVQAQMPSDSEIDETRIKEIRGFSETLASRAIERAKKEKADRVTRRHVEDALEEGW